MTKNDMQETISKIKTPIKVDIKVPGDKSISHRSVIFGSIAEGITEVEDFLTGEDCLCTMKAFQELGVEMEFNESAKKLKIHGKGLAALKAPGSELYMGNSGTAMRLLAGLFSGLPFSTTLTGDESLSGRPMKRVIEPLSKMGAVIQSVDGKAPLKINPNASPKKLQSINYTSPIASAQVKSCILLAGLNADGETIANEPHKSRDHLERMLEYFGADIKTTGNEVRLKPLSKNLQAQKITVPSDISSAAFFLVAGAILPDTELSLINVGINPTRIGILEIFNKMNVDYQLSNKRIIANEPVANIIVRSSQIQACTMEGEVIPKLIDEIPILAILAAQAEGVTVIKDAEELRVKESDRIKTTVNMLKALGIEVEEKPDGMIIHGRAGQAFEPSTKPVIDSHGDHRLAMSSAIAALYSNKPITILQTEFVNTSFPGFFELLESLNAES
jgi:3-phosphoshikimate 1-carboxyvinyltransferase